MRLNKKGLTLTELIVSFAIVAVAVVYFYQTLYTVRKLYATAQTETQEFVDKTYAIKMVDAYIDKNGTTDLDGGNTSKTKICEAFSLKYLKDDNICENVELVDKDDFNEITINWSDKSVTFNKAVKILPLAENKVKVNDWSNISEYEINQLTAGIFNGAIPRDQIETLKFIRTKLTPTGYNDSNSWDASEAQDGSIKAWYKINDHGLYDVVVGGDGKLQLPNDCNGLFVYLNSIKRLDLSNFNTSNVTNMSGMFAIDMSLTDLIFGDNFNTENVVDMSDMFSGCLKLKNLNLNNFDTGNVKNMSGMFGLIARDPADSSSSIELDLSNFDTTNVENMNDMFLLSSIKTLTLGEKFVTDKVTDMGGMFSGCDKLTSLDLHNFNTNSVKIMKSNYVNGGMFFGCSSLTNLDISNFNFDSIESIDSTTFGVPNDCKILVKNENIKTYIKNIKNSLNNIQVKN